MSAQKPTLYPDANMHSSRFYRGASTALLARKVRTCEWWEKESRNFKLVSSATVFGELSNGVYVGKANAMAAAKKLPFLPKTSDVVRCAQIYLELGLFPPAEDADAMHLALATVHRIDYLLTWNYAHLANPVMLPKFEWVNLKNGWRTPLLVSPGSIPWHSLGQSIRRRS